MGVNSTKTLKLIESDTGKYIDLTVCPGRVRQLFYSGPHKEDHPIGVSPIYLHFSGMNGECDDEGLLTGFDLTEEDALYLIYMLTDALHDTKKAQQEARGNIFQNHDAELSKAREEIMQIKAKVDELTPKPKAKPKAKTKKKATKAK
jgi:hypothetical protein